MGPDPTGAATLRIARRIAPGLIALRRDLHAHPELGLLLPRTQQAVLDALAGLDLEITLGRGLSSVTAVLRGGAAPGTGPRPAVLLRADMDGLPVTEDLDLPYASTVPGVMHACGHDLHVAALVGATQILHERRADLAGDVVLMFQPAEEGPGGAAPMIAEGVLEAAGSRVSAAFALHVAAAEYPLGQWFSRRGELMAAADTVHLRLEGAGGHGSQPHRALDPVPALCEVVLAWQTMLGRTVDAFDPVVLTVGRLRAGTVDNVIPDHADLSATLRTFSAAARADALAGIERVAAGIAAAHGLRADVQVRDGYPATVNDDAAYDLARQVVEDLFGADRYSERPRPELGSEDMAVVMNEVPGAYFYLGACPGPDHETAPDNHSPRAAFDDSVLPDAAAWLAEVALRRLALADLNPGGG